MLLGIPLTDLGLLAAALLAAGALTGVLAGLFGVGGGAILVPVLYEVFAVLGVPEQVRMALCVGTSLAIIVPTSVRSFLGHRAQGAVDAGVLRLWAVPVVAGVLAGSVVARYAEPWVFKAVFALVASIMAAKLLFGRESWRVAEALPSGLPLRLYGLVIGLLSALMGIGGGALATMMMTLHGRPIHNAIATSAGFGVLISIPGTLGYMAAGWPRMDLLPPLSIGYVSLLGFALMVPTSILTTPLGVRLAHALPRRRLEVAFGLFLLLAAARLLAALA